MASALSIISLLLLVVVPAVIAFIGQPSGFDLFAVELAAWWQPTLLTLLLTFITTLAVVAISLQLGRVSQGTSNSWLSLILAMPHVAFAVGLLFLLSPSGYLVRLAEALTGWLPSPPMGWPLPEKSMLTLILVLVAKEIPFLLLMIATQLHQLPYQRWLLQAQSLGWSAQRSWWLVVVPALLPRLALPIAAIAIYTVSVVDIPMLVGPNAPGVLALQVYQQQYQWNEADASVGIVLLVGCGLLVIVAGKFLQSGYQQLAAKWRWQGAKWSSRRWSLRWVWINRLLLWLSLGSVVMLAAQSVAGAWFYPSLVADDWQWQRWQQEWPYAWPLLLNSAWVAVVSALLGVTAAVAVLERQRQRNERSIKAFPLLLLLVPQLVLVLGWQRWLGQGSDGVALVWSHAVFCFPYAYLVMHGAWVNFDERWLYQAQSLGYSYRQAWWRLLLPMLKGPLAMGYAVAFAVSIAQYLPTQWLAGGSLPTLTTETVSIASGGDWRLASIYGLLQALLPLLVFAGLIKGTSHAVVK